MTTPPTPAGWYPDPDGSGGQRYWDGSAWTEHRSPATPEPQRQRPPPNPLAASSRPPSSRSGPTGERVGAHRAPEPEHEPEVTPEPEPRPEPEPEPTAVIDLDSAVPSEQHHLGHPDDAVGRAVVRSAPFEPPPSEPAHRSAPRRTRAASSSSGSARHARPCWRCSCLSSSTPLFIHKDDTVQVSSGPSTSTSKSAAPTTSSGNGSGQRHGDRERITNDRFRFRPASLRRRPYVRGHRRGDRAVGAIAGRARGADRTGRISSSCT